MDASPLRLIERFTSFNGRLSRYAHTSAACGGEMRFMIYLPPQALGGETVPVLYYLAGLTCTEETFMIKAGALRVAAELGIALVAPDTSPRQTRVDGDDAGWDFGLGAGFYVDATEAPWSAAYRMYSYVTRELPDLVAASFPAVDPTRAGIFGHSMGGHGALVCALRNPGQYRSVSAFAPICAPSQVPWGEKAFAGYLGADRAAWSQYDATELVKRAPFPAPILIDQGLSDKFLRAQLRPDLFRQAAEGAGQAVVYREHAGYDHGYFFISTFIEDHLRHHAQYLAG